jgi:CRISPR-associated protein Csh2
MNYNNRVYGCAIIKAINSNYNADFSGQPRTLPDGTVYATDKAFKYTIRYYFTKIYPNEKVFYFQTPKLETGNPMSLDNKYDILFPDTKNEKDKKIVNGNLLKCIDIRLFGATYANKAKKVNISIHGPLQVNHAKNIWYENNIFTEQIKAPFADPKAKKEKSGEGEESFDEAAMTTIGRQSKLQEGHYVHHFSINPQNLKDSIAVAGENGTALLEEDIIKLKESMRQGATFYDSAAKAGTDNEILFWVQLNRDSKLILPAFTDLVKALPEKQDEKTVFDFVKVSALLSNYLAEIEKVELFINEQSTIAINLPSDCNNYPLFGNNSEKV